MITGGDVMGATADRSLESLRAVAVAAADPRVLGQRGVERPPADRPDGPTRFVEAASRDRGELAVNGVVAFVADYLSLARWGLSDVAAAPRDRGPRVGGQVREPAADHVLGADRLVPGAAGDRVVVTGFGVAQAVERRGAGADQVGAAAGDAPVGLRGGVEAAARDRRVAAA